MVGDGDHPVLVGGQHAFEFLADPVERSDHLDHDIRADELREMLGADQLTLDTGRADLEDILAGDGIQLIERRVQRAGHILTVVDIHAAVFVDEHPQKPLRALFEIAHIPDAQT